jgi:hypothetical protein
VHRETSGSTFLPSGFSTLCRTFSSTICDRIETEISRVDLRTPGATQRVSRTISVRVSIAHDLRSRIGQALSRKKEKQEKKKGTRGDLVVTTHRELRAVCDPVAPSCRRRLDPTAKRSADPKIHVFELTRRRPLERGGSPR